MVLVTIGEAQPVQAGAKSRSSTKSKASRSSRRSKSTRGGWYCCPCPLTALRGSSASAPCSRAGVGGHDEERLWPAPAKFYCCRADLVSAMAREHTANNTANNNSCRAMDGHSEDGVHGDDDDDDLSYEIAEEALPDATFREVFDRSHQQDPDERWQVTDPDLPYVENLPHQLDVGRAIVVEGTVLPDAIGFAINLSCGAGDSPDIAFHLNPRLDRCYVARNSRTKKIWDEEEGASLGGSPLKRGQSFIIHILVTATSFKVSVDRMHFCNFQYRKPFSKVCRVEIHGDVSLSTVFHTRLEVYPERPLADLPEHTFCTIPTDHAVPWSLDFPEKENLFIGRFKPNLTAGMEVTVKGRVKLLPQSFYVNLQQGCQLWPHPNVHFHLNPRFAAEDSEPIVVVNGWMRGSWGSEQRYNRCRFRPGEPFSMVIYVEEQRYRVMVNGLQQAAFFHRAPPSLVDTLVVRGDLYIGQVSISKSAPHLERLPTPASPSASLRGVLIPKSLSSHTTMSSDNQSEAESPCQKVAPSQAEIDISTEIPPPADLVAENSPATSAASCSSMTENQNSAPSSQQDNSEITGGNSSLQVFQQENLTEPVEKGSLSEETTSAPDTSLISLPKAGLSMLVMAVLYGGYILRK